MANTAYYQDNLSQFDDLLTSGKKIFVVNNTEPKGLLSTTINDPISGKSIKLEFPRTWIPFNLTAMLPRNVLEHNVDLRRTLQKNILKIVPEEEAMTLLNSERGRKEYSRLAESEYAAGSRLDSTRKQSLMAAVANSQQAVNSLDNPSVNKEELSLHPKIRPWEQRIVVNELDGAGLLNELEIHANELTEADFQFLLTGQFPQEVKEYAQERLSSGNVRTKPMITGGIPVEKYESDWDIEVK